MIKIIALLCCTYLVAGCVSEQQLAKNREEMSQKELLWASVSKELFTAKKDAIITCISKSDCDKAFSLTKVFISQNSDMKIQTSDDTIISTFNPRDSLTIGMTATRTPDKGESSVIEINAKCYVPPVFASLIDTKASFETKTIVYTHSLPYEYFTQCANTKQIPIYINFKKYVQSKLL